MTDKEQYTQLVSWEDLVEWLEKFDIIVKDAPVWNPKPKRKNKKTPPQMEGLFD